VKVTQGGVVPIGRSVVTVSYYSITFWLFKT
jgi:hypothetical protein